MTENYIESEIKKRKIIYYPVSDDDLDFLKAKNMWSDIFMILTSLSLSVLMSALLTKHLSIGLTLEIIRFVNVIVLFSSFLTAIFFTFTLIFNISSKNAINKIKTLEPERLEVERFIKQPNPDYYVGNKKIIMNIKLEQKEQFLKLFKNERRFELLETKTHNNTRETKYFTFLIVNGNDKIFSDFQEFLHKNKIEYKDFK